MTKPLQYPFPKAPGDVLDYSYDFTEFLNGATPTNPEVTCVSGGLEVSDVQLNGNAVSCIVSGGSIGRAVLEFTVDFDGGRQVVRQAILNVRDR